MACCDLVDNGGGIFKPMSQRPCCTNIICLLIWLISVVIMIVIAVFALADGNIDKILYPRDKYGNYCGRDTSVSDMKYAFFPQLDQDISQQMAIILAGAWWNFQPTTLCVRECPTAFSLSNPQSFGGLAYPGRPLADPDATTYYVMNPTTQVYHYCLPQSISNAGLNRKLCSLPTCSAGCGGVPKTCTEVASDPAANSVAWVIETPADEACCQMSVQEVNTQRFMPPLATADTVRYEEMFAEYVTGAYGVIRALSESLSTVLAMGVGAPFGFAFVWFILLFLFAGFIIVAALILMFVALVLAAVYFFYKASGMTDPTAMLDAATALFNGTDPAVEDTSDMSQVVYIILGTLFSISSILYLIFVIVWRQAVFQAIAIVREVTKVLFALPFMCVWPAVSVAFQLGVVVYAVMIGGFILSQEDGAFDSVATALAASANSSTGGDGAAAIDAALATFTSTDSQVIMALMLTVHIIGCIWAYYITVCATYTTLARSAAVWFFSHGLDESSGEVVQKGTFFGGTRIVLACAWCVISRHMGSIVFGAAILTFMTILKMILEFIDYYTRDLQQSNFLLKLVVKCSKCCLYCMDRTVKFITYYGFIFVAIEGCGFCEGCKNTFHFVMKYAAQMSVNSLVSTILKFVISLSIPVACGVIGFMIVDGNNGYGPMWCGAAIFLVAYVIASVVSDVFKTCIDTIFVCAFKDLEDNTPPKFMSTSLRRGFGMEDVQGGPKLEGPTSTKQKGSSVGQDVAAKV